MWLWFKPQLLINTSATSCFCICHIFVIVVILSSSKRLRTFSWISLWMLVTFLSQYWDKSHHLVLSASSPFSSNIVFNSAERCCGVFTVELRGPTVAPPRKPKTGFQYWKLNVTFWNVCFPMCTFCFTFCLLVIVDTIACKFIVCVFVFAKMFV